MARHRTDGATLPEAHAVPGFATLAGLSRKSMIGAVTGRAIDQRVYGSVAAALIAAQRGARIIRVHDVAATVEALQVWGAAGLPRWPTIADPLSSTS